MRLLLDQNLSPRLVEHLSDIYPNSTHVADVGLDRALDRALWEYARENEFIIVTKDADFSEMSLLQGFPPNVIWIRQGNCSTDDIEHLLRTNQEAAEALANHSDMGVLELHE